MIQKIDERALHADQALFQHLSSLFRSWNVLWWVGIVGFLGPREQQKLKRSIKEILHHFYKRCLDPDSTFPFELTTNHTRETRLLLEIMTQLNREVQRLNPFLSPKAFEAFFLKLDSKSNHPVYMASTLPVKIGSTIVGEYTDRVLGDPLFKPNEIFKSQFELNPGPEIQISLVPGYVAGFHPESRPLFRVPILQSASKPVEAPVVTPDPAPEIGDAGFAVDFGNQDEKDA